MHIDDTINKLLSVEVKVRVMVMVMVMVMVIATVRVGLDRHHPEAPWRHGIRSRALPYPII